MNLLASFPQRNALPGPRHMQAIQTARAMIVMALAVSVNQDDRDDWYPARRETGARSMEDLPQMIRRLIEAEQLLASHGRCDHPVWRATADEEASR